MTKTRRKSWLKWTLVALLAVPLLYLLAALAGALVPRNPGWQEPDAGVQIFVRTNGVHADLVLPADAEGVDWYALLPPDHVRDPGAADGWVGIGWGQREFYLETERWADLTLRTAVRALTGGDPLMHVAHMGTPRPSAAHRPLRLPPDAYRRMAEAIAASFERDADGAAIPLTGEGYRDNDTFYEAHGTYHAFRTSNQWTGDILGHAGVRIGVWTPFEQGIMWRFRDEADERDRLGAR
ncbi:MAG: TIGR02117 family protein [Allosphingosinicella sp.]|uniref:TIGR02117 family protein n=1 Tax=Allosphingosinicella sp. TaxID=2823234 RepID=UPI003959E577